MQFDIEPQLQHNQHDQHGDRLARIAAELNKRMENIGARRLQTILAQLLDETLYAVPDEDTGALTVDREFVAGRLHDAIKDEDLSRYIL